MTFRAQLHGGPCDGVVTTFILSNSHGLPEKIVVLRKNPGVILVSIPHVDPVVLAESFVVYNRTGLKTPEGIEVYSCLRRLSAAVR